MTTPTGPRGADPNAISESQASYIRDNVPGAAIYPPGSQPGGAIPSEFFYRANSVLTRDQDLQPVLNALTRLGPTLARGDNRLERAEVAARPIPGLVRIELIFNQVPGQAPDQAAEAAAQIMFRALDAVEQEVGPGKLGPDHLLALSAVTWCPATEPDPVPPDSAPQPGISSSDCDGRGTLVAVVDEGLVEDAPFSHPWMQGVTGAPDQGVTGGAIERYAGHGTFIAGIVRAMAPRADVRVARAFKTAAAAFESDVVTELLTVLDWAPDVISLSAGTHTLNSGGLLSFQVFVDGPLRERPGTVLVAAAGNDGADWKFSPAEMKSVIGVGALGPPGDARALFSNYGDWVKVYAPGQDLVNAFATGTYTYQEQNPGTQADFTGMAKWSGTSFSTPIVAGLIAARMSGTGENAHEAAESLLRLARAQALPGIGPVLHPGQACLCVCEHPCRDRHHHGPCGCQTHSPWQSLGDRIASSPLAQQLSAWVKSQRSG
jgi:Subtilase family